MPITFFIIEQRVVRGCAKKMLERRSASDPTTGAVTPAPLHLGAASIHLHICCSYGIDFLNSSHAHPGDLATSEKCSKGCQLRPTATAPLRGLRTSHRRLRDLRTLAFVSPLHKLLRKEGRANQSLSLPFCDGRRQLQMLSRSTFRNDASRSQTWKSLTVCPLANT